MQRDRDWNNGGVLFSAEGDRSTSTSDEVLVGDWPSAERESGRSFGLYVRHLTRVDTENNYKVCVWRVESLAVRVIKPYLSVGPSGSCWNRE